MSKAICVRQKQIICEFCGAEDYEKCQNKKCENLNLPKGVGLYLFDKVKKRDGNEEEGIYELWLKEYHNIHEFCNPEPAKVDYILFYPSKRTIFLIEISDLYRNWIHTLKEKLRTEVWNFLSKEKISIQIKKEIRQYIIDNSHIINKLKQFREFLKNDFTTKLQQYIPPEKVELLKKEFLSKLTTFSEEFHLQKKNEMVKKIDDTLRIFEIFFERIGKAKLFDFYWQKFKLKVILIVPPKEYHQVIFSLVSRIKLRKLKYKNIICDNCQSMENFQRNLMLTDA